MYTLYLVSLRRDEMSKNGVCEVVGTEVERQAPELSTDEGAHELSGTHNHWHGVTPPKLKWKFNLQ